MVGDEIRVVRVRAVHLAVHPGLDIRLAESSVPDADLVDGALEIVIPLAAVTASSDAEGPSGRQDRSRGRLRLVQLSIHIGLEVRTVVGDDDVGPCVQGNGRPLIEVAQRLLTPGLIESTAELVVGGYLEVVVGTSRVRFGEDALVDPLVCSSVDPGRESKGGREVQGGGISDCYILIDPVQLQRLPEARKGCVVHGADGHAHSPRRGVGAAVV